MTLEHSEVIRIQTEIMSGSSWEEHTPAVPDTDEAREMWGKIEANIRDMRAQGFSPDLPNELAIDPA